MDFRRIPFQFTSTDPAKRQSELQKRFGIPPKQEKMFVDIANPGFLDTRKKESNSASSSPRLQHRVPIFVDGMNGADKSDTNPTNVDAGQKSRVRIVPIEIENPDGTKRHRTLSGSSCGNSNSHHPGSWISDDVHPKAESLASKLSNGPKVFNIPVKIEGGKDPKVKASPGKKGQAPKPVKKDSTPEPVLQNGCNVTKVSNTEEKKVPERSPCEISMKKIDVVLEKLVGYQSDVEKFSGSMKEKQYRYLDEMLTRLMLDLDDVETMGNENIRMARKAAIKKVQHCIDLLESKVTDNSRNPSEPAAEVSEEVVQEEPCDAEKKIEEKVCDVASSEAVGAATNDSSVPDVEMEDSMTDVQVPDAVESTEVPLQAEQVQPMETDDPTVCSDKPESEPIPAESQAELSDQVPSKDKVSDSKLNESEISEVEMEDKTFSQESGTSIEVKEMQVEPQQDSSVLESNNPDVNKDCSETSDIANDPSSIAVSNIDPKLASNSSAQNDCSTNEVKTDVLTDPVITEGVGQSGENIPVVKTDTYLESLPSKHSHVPSAETATIEEVPKKLKVQN